MAQAWPAAIIVTRPAAATDAHSLGDELTLFEHATHWKAYQSARLPPFLRRIALAQLKFWDNILVPLSRLADRLTGFALGKSVLALVQKPAVGTSPSAGRT